MRSLRHVVVLALLGMTSARLGRAQGTAPDSTGAPPDTAAAPAPLAPPPSPVTPSPSPVTPESAPPDTGLGGFLRGLADSTDVYFGPSSAPVDTVGLDSTLAFRLANPDPMADMRKTRRASWAPWFSFNRADGPLYGGVLTLGRAERLGAISGRAGYAVGPNEWLGGVSYRKRWVTSMEGQGAEVRRRRRGETAWTFEGTVARYTTIIDPDGSMSWQRVLRALTNGSDRHHYYRRDGYQLKLERESFRWRIGAQFRDQEESPLITTTTWNFLSNEPEVPFNLPAATGRVRETELEVTTRIPRTGWQAETHVRFSSDVLASDFDYERYVLATGGDVGIWHFATAVPQFVYGRLQGDVIPQAAFYFGGPHSLRSISTNALAGSRKAFGKIDLIFTPDLGRALHLPIPTPIVLQGGMFAGSGAVWGKNPYGGPPVAGGAWPESESWLSEVGVSLLYRPGLPEPRGFLRLDYARGVGNNPNTKITVHYSVPLDLLHRLE